MLNTKALIMVTIMLLSVSFEVYSCIQFSEFDLIELVDDAKEDKEDKEERTSEKEKEFHVQNWNSSQPNVSQSILFNEYPFTWESYLNDQTKISLPKLPPESIV
jgi:hypothetical protein